MLELFAYQMDDLMVTQDISTVDDYSVIQKGLTDNFMDRCIKAGVIYSDNKKTYLTTIVVHRMF